MVEVRKKERQRERGRVVCMLYILLTGEEGGGGEVLDRWREAASEACDEQRQLRSFARLNRHKEGRERE